MESTQNNNFADESYQNDFPLGSDGVIVADRNLTIISFSEDAERILGYNMNEVTGKSLTEIFGDHVNHLNFAFMDTLENGNIHSNLSIVINNHHDTDQKRISFSISPLRSIQKKIAGVVMTFRDIDEMIHLFHEVSEKNYEVLVERNKLASILNSITDGVFTIDLNWRITSINQAAQQITGYSEKEVLGQNCGELLRGSHCEQACPMKRTLESGVPTKTVEVEIRTKDGERIPISVSTALLYDDQDNIIGAVETFRDKSDILKLTEALETRFRFDRILGKSKPMQELYDLLENVVETDSTVLIQGESGTGKELVARAIHYNGTRNKKPFVAVNCSALSENLLESELFGHEKGAFTGAINRKPGRFELANGGTLFLDEVADMSQALQVKLLRVLDEQVFERVGGTTPIQVDVRIIAVTNKNLWEEVRQGRFREDLYYRLNVVPIKLPTLRQRQEDIPLLVNHFIAHFKQKMNKPIQDISPEAMERLMQYDWPGNIRELENALEQSFVRCRDEEIQVYHLPEHIARQEGPQLEKDVHSLKAPVQQTERQVIKQILQDVDQNRQKAARRLGISKATLWRKMKKYELL